MAVLIYLVLSKVWDTSYSHASVCKSSRANTASLFLSLRSTSSLPSRGSDHEHVWPSALPETQRSVTAWASTQQPPAVHLNRKHRRPRSKQIRGETKRSYYAAAREDNKKRGVGREVMEAIKVPERRRDKWQTRPVKFNFCRARLAKLKTFPGWSRLWRSRGGNIHCGRKCEGKIKGLYDCGAASTGAEMIWCAG